MRGLQSLIELAMSFKRAWRVFRDDMIAVDPGVRPPCQCRLCAVQFLFSKSLSTPKQPTQACELVELNIKYCIVEKKRYIIRGRSAEGA